MKYPQQPGHTRTNIPERTDLQPLAGTQPLHDRHTIRTHRDPSVRDTGSTKPVDVPANHLRMDVILNKPISTRHGFLPMYRPDRFAERR